jgi:L-malate glycosyltransferase
MRILLACEFFFPSVGGVQEVVRQVGQRLVARGHEVTVATSHLPARTSLDLDGVRIVEFKVSGNLVRGLAGEVDAYRRLVLSGQYDVFMVKAAQQWTFDGLLPVLDLVRKKVFVPCGFSALYEPAYAEYYRDMPGVLRKFDHLIFYAADYRDINMARDHGVTTFSIVPNGASEREFGVARDAGFRRRNGIDDDAFVVLTVGTFTGEMKGHRELANAFASAQFPAKRAVLILNGNFVPEPSGGGMGALARSASASARRLRGRLRAVRRTSFPGSSAPAAQVPIEAIVARINETGPAKRAIIADFPRPELVQAYMNSDLFVFASKVEYSPLVLYESAAAGLPFLTVPVGNAAEIAEWTGGGVVCPAPRDERGYTRVDPGVLAENISDLAADRKTLLGLGEAGREAWLRSFTWDKITDKYETILANVARSAGR